jgi:hypothetical protein
MDELSETYEKIKTRLMRRSFYQLVYFSERDVKKSGKDRNGDAKEDHFDGKIAAISVINEEDWREKLTPEELEIHCRYYRDKIEEV